MANVILGEKREGDARIRSSGGIAILEETYSFIVESDDKNNSRIEILATPGLPVVGRTLSSFGYTICKTKNATRRANNPMIWDVVCEFSSEVDESQSSQNPESDPEAWLPIYETKFERYQEVVTKDYSGTAIANSAGQPFENGLTITRHVPVWEFFQIESGSISDETIIARSETVNNAVFRGRAAKTLLCIVLSSVVGFYYGQRRRLTQYQLKYNERTWKHKRLDVGTVYLDSGAIKPYLDSGTPPNVILGALNGSGAKASVGSPPAVREFDMYPSVNFSSFLRA